MMIKRLDRLAQSEGQQQQQYMIISLIKKRKRESVLSLGGFQSQSVWES